MNGRRILFFGMEGPFSRAPLRALLAECEVCAVVVPPPAGMASTAASPPGELPRVPHPAGMAPASAPLRRLVPPPRRPGAVPLLAAPQERTVVGLAWEAGVRVLEVQRPGDAHAVSVLRELAPDLICVACFPRLLPTAVLALPRCGALNVHPSLLPAYRGPEPLFWVFHDGLERAGVTVHMMDARADTGDVVARAPVALPDGIAYEEAERRCSQVGADLLLEALHATAAGTMRRTPQSESGASIAPVPVDEDFIVTPAWPARRAFNFMRGVAGWVRPVVFEAGQERFIVDEAMAYDEAETPRETVQRVGDALRLRCTPGVLTVTCRTSVTALAGPEEKGETVAGHSPNPTTASTSIFDRSAPAAHSPLGPYPNGPSH